MLAPAASNSNRGKMQVAADTRSLLNKLQHIGAREALATGVATASVEGCRSIESGQLLMALESDGRGPKTPLTAPFFLKIKVQYSSTAPLGGGLSRYRV